VSAKSHKLAYFLSGCLAGSIVTGTLFFVWLQTRPPSPSATEDRSSPPEAVAEAEPETEAKCPGLTAAAPDWLPAAGDAARLKKLHVPRSLRKRVNFWKTVWGKRSNHVHLLVDKRRPWVIHKTVDCRRLFKSGAPTVKKEKQCGHLIAKAKRKVVKKLRRQRRRPRRALLKAFGRNRRLAKTAYKNIIKIEGRRESLQKALERGESFLADVEKVFAGVGLPASMARMTIIESLAHPGVESSRGAVGAYQFVADTARYYLMIRDGVDERLDPLRSGWAAARYLKELHKQFRSWPLALTAYNTGPTRLKRMIKRRRTRDVGRLADRGDYGSFGFDGQNYYAQIAAVIELTAKFNGRPNNHNTKVYRLPRPMPLSEVAECLEAPVEKLVAANPALTQPIAVEGAPAPEGYLMAVPQNGEETASNP
jgi:membrane-bound lytic murein transglycosylase D